MMNLTSSAYLSKFVENKIELPYLSCNLTLNVVQD